MEPVRRLENLMTRLRSKGGCPWDRRQTHQSLKPYLLEEAHEVADAIDSKDTEALKEELGDLLLQVVFHAQMAKEKDRFNFSDVARTIGDKLVRRHPHVFGNEGKKTVKQVNQRWEELKKAEKPTRRSVLDGLPKSLPGLLRAQRMYEKTSKTSGHGSHQDLREQLEHSWNEMKIAFKIQNQQDRSKTIGQFLLLLTQWAQEKGVHAEMALRSASFAFEKDFRKKELALKTASIDRPSSPAKPKRSTNRRKRSPYRG